MTRRARGPRPMCGRPSWQSHPPSRRPGKARERARKSCRIKVGARHSGRNAPQQGRRSPCARGRAKRNVGTPSAVSGETNQKIPGAAFCFVGGQPRANSQLRPPPRSSQTLLLQLSNSSIQYKLSAVLLGVWSPAHTRARARPFPPASFAFFRIANATMSRRLLTGAMALLITIALAAAAAADNGE